MHKTIHDHRSELEWRIVFPWCIRGYDMRANLAEALHMRTPLNV
jgi:hypothetical protein